MKTYIKYVSALVAITAAGFVCDVAANPSPEAGASQQQAAVFDLKDLDVMPVVKLQTAPKYPYALRKEGIKGEALVEFVVDSGGLVRDASVMKCTHAEFGEAAVAAVQNWMFRPGQKAGRPVSVRMQVPIVFSL